MRSSKQRQRNKQNRNSRPSGGNIINRVFDSSGPEGKVRGTPQQIIEKYLQLHRDAQLAGDRVNAENFAQHAEHYTRLLAEAQRDVDRVREEQEQSQRDRQQERDRSFDRERQFEQAREGQGRDVQARDGQSRERDGRDRDQNRDQPREVNRDREQNRDLRNYPEVRTLEAGVRLVLTQLVDSLDGPPNSSATVIFVDMLYSYSPWGVSESVVRCGARSRGASVPCSTCCTCSAIGMETPRAAASSRIGVTDDRPSAVCCWRSMRAKRVRTPRSVM